MLIMRIPSEESHYYESAIMEVSNTTVLTSTNSDKIFKVISFLLLPSRFRANFEANVEQFQITSNGTSDRLAHMMCDTHR